MKKFYLFLMSFLALASGTFTISAQEAAERIEFRGQAMRVNDAPIGWDTSNPVSVEKNADGKYVFTVRFTGSCSCWQMCTDADNYRESCIIPSFDVAFVDYDPLPEDLYVKSQGIECFNGKYLETLVGKTILLGDQPNAATWICSSPKPTVYTVEINGDLTEMLITKAEVIHEEIEYPEALYLIGDGVPSGWDAATPMTKIDNGVYQYTGELKVGNFNILGQDPKIDENWDNAYGQESAQTINFNGVSDSRIQFFATKPGDCYYKVEFADQYVLTVDLENSIISAVVNHLYINGVPTDWNFVAMENEGNGIFSYRAYFDEAGQPFGLMIKPEWTDAYKVSTNIGKDYEFGLGDYSEKLVYGLGFSIKNAKPGHYVVRVDLKTLTLYTSTYNPDPVETLYVVTKGEYNKMSKQANGTFLWTGEVGADFVITPGTSAYPCYMPLAETVSVPASGLIGNKMLFNHDSSNGVENKWTVEKPGQYTVLVNPTAMTVSIGDETIAGVDDIKVVDPDAPVEYYDLFGRKVENPGKGFYIRVQGGKASKVIL